MEKKFTMYSQQVSIAPNTSQLIAKTPLKHIKANVNDYVMKSSFSSTSDSSSIKTFSPFYVAKPKDLKLPQQDVSTKITKTDHGFIIKVSANTLQKNVFLYTNTKGHFSDNFFDVFPNETKTIKFITKAAAMDDLGIKTLNGIQ